MTKIEESVEPVLRMPLTQPHVAEARQDYEAAVQRMGSLFTGGGDEAP
jgi:hypothetical protein